MTLIDQLEEEEAKTLGREIPSFRPGDTLLVKVKDGNRVQRFEGLCIARSGSGFRERMIVRKISNGEGVERVFPIYAPCVESIEVVRKGKVRRAKLYYIRKLRGKKARIRERIDFRPKKEGGSEGEKPAA